MVPDPVLQVAADPPGGPVNSHEKKYIRHELVQSGDKLVFHEWTKQERTSVRRQHDL